MLSGGTFVGQSRTKSIVGNGRFWPFWRLSVAATYQSGFDAENASNRRPQQVHIVELADWTRLSVCDHHDSLHSSE
jgi:hypothetical protein